MKLLKGLFFSAFATYIVSLVIFTLVNIGDDFIIPIILGTAIYAPIVIIGGLIIWGIPCHLLLQKFKSNDPFFYALAGFVPIPMCLAIFSPFGEKQLPEFLGLCAIFGFIGAVSASMLWYSVVYKKS